VEEELLQLPATSIISQWKPNEKESLKATNEMNLFNDNLNFSCKSFDDIKRLNKEMRSVAEKFCWLDPSKSPPILRAYLSNYEVLQVYLGELEGRLQDKESKHSLFSNKIQQLNDLHRQISNQIEEENSKEKSKWPEPGAKNRANSVELVFDKSHTWDPNQEWILPDERKNKNTERRMTPPRRT